MVVRRRSESRVGLFFTEQDEEVCEEDFSDDEIFEENTLVDKDVKDKLFNFYSTFISWTVNSRFLEEMVEKSNKMRIAVQMSQRRTGICVRIV